jgi:hypothetical protein
MSDSSLSLAAMNEINLETAKNHRTASELALKKMTETLDMRTTIVAQMAATLLTGKQPYGSQIKEAVEHARAILAEVEHPTKPLMPSDVKAVLRDVLPVTFPSDRGKQVGQKIIAGTKVPPVVIEPGQPVRIGWYPDDKA